MKKDLFDLLKNKYPYLLKNINEIYIEDGWFNLIDQSLENIDKYISFHIKDESVKNKIYIAQIKEKFGKLRIYLNDKDYPPFIDGVIYMAESMSKFICEICGNAGQIRNRLWIRTLCDNCILKK